MEFLIYREKGRNYNTKLLILNKFPNVKTTVIFVTLLRSETSHYQKIKKIKRDSSSSGERNWNKNIKENIMSKFVGMQNQRR